MCATGLVTLALSTTLHADEQLCVSAHFDDKAFIDYVIDGDTVILRDKRHVRLVGIDTPEIYHDGRAAEAGAIEARKRLQSLLPEGQSVRLQYDAEEKDRHGRTLAHLYLPDGRNIQALLLAEGLAVPLFIPPSVARAACYATVARQARASRNGLWALPNYQPVATTELSNDHKGWRTIRGKVDYVSESRSSIWINLDGGAALRIIRSDLKWFAGRDFSDLPGKTIEASGYLYYRNRQLRMRLRYPLDFTIIEN